MKPKTQQRIQVMQALTMEPQTQSKMQKKQTLKILKIPLKKSQRRVKMMPRPMNRRKDKMHLMTMIALQKSKPPTVLLTRP